MIFLPLPFKSFHFFLFHSKKFIFSFADIVEGETDKDDGNSIENFMGFVFLLWLQVF